MHAFPEPGRHVAHVYLDAASVYDRAAVGTSVNEEAVNLAVQRVGDIEGAYVVEVNDAGGETSVSLDLSNVLGGAIITVTRLVHLLADERGVDEAVVIAEMREYLDVEV
jgi:hypothetical protein